MLFRCFCFEFGDSRPKPLNAVFNLAPFFIGKRQTSADGPAQFVIFFLGGWRGRTFCEIFFWAAGHLQKKSRAGPVLSGAACLLAVRFYMYSRARLACLLLYGPVQGEPHSAMRQRTCVCGGWLVRGTPAA